MNSFQQILFSVVTFLLFSFSCVQVWAQPDSNDEAAEDIEEVIITARKWSENLQEIPDSVTVFNEDDIRNARIQTIKDISLLTPNLTVSNNFRSGLNFITVRGLITPQVGSPPIAFVVDGVTVPSIEFINQGLHQIERIEVLRGPQSAVYGKNAIGGAINIVTKRPSDDFEVPLQVSFAQGGDVRFAGAISGPISERIKFRISANYQTFDGLIDNTFLRETVDFVDQSIALQGSLHAAFSEKTTLDFHLRYADWEKGNNYQERIPSPARIEDFSIYTIGNVVGLDRSTFINTSLKVDHSTALGDMTFILGYNDADVLQFSDTDFNNVIPDPAFAVNFNSVGVQDNPITEEATILEFRFASRADGDFRWLAGVSYETRDNTVTYNDILDINPTERVTLETSLLGRPNGSVVALNIATAAHLTANGISTSAMVFNGEGERTIQDSNSYAFFAQGDYQFTDKLGMTLAMRYDSEERHAFDARPGNSTRSDVVRTFSQFQPKASLNYQITDNALLSLTYSNGFRPGGYNEYNPVVVRSYESEVSDTYELGFKLSFRDGKAIVNGALFQIEQENAQFTRFNSASFTLENLNAQGVDINGLELEVTNKFNENFELAFGYGLVNNEITRAAVARVGDGTVTLGRVGASMPYVADFNWNLTLLYRYALSGGNNLNARLSANTLGPRQFTFIEDADNLSSGKSSAHTFVNASIGIQNDTWGVLLYGSNITDELHAEVIYRWAPFIRIRNQPRQVGLQFNYKF